MQTAMMVVNTLKELNIISISFRIVLAVICGGVIGAERGRAHQPAGMRTLYAGVPRIDTCYVDRTVYV